MGTDESWKCRRGEGTACGAYISENDFRTALSVMGFGFLSLDLPLELVEVDVDAYCSWYLWDGSCREKE